MLGKNRKGKKPNPKKTARGWGWGLVAFRVGTDQKQEHEATFWGNRKGLSRQGFRQLPKLQWWKTNTHSRT